MSEYWPFQILISIQEKESVLGMGLKLTQYFTPNWSVKYWDTDLISITAPTYWFLAFSRFLKKCVFVWKTGIQPSSQACEEVLREKCVWLPCDKQLAWHSFCNVKTNGLRIDKGKEVVVYLSVANDDRL